MTARNDNRPAKPILKLTPTGDGTNLYRTLARVIVRRELMFARLIPDRPDCDGAIAAG